MLRKISIGALALSVFGGVVEAAAVNSTVGAAYCTFSLHQIAFSTELLSFLPSFSYNQ